jgi:glyoxylase-like metal-dependent hydrolase (beta-lactamase superfamily II)
LRIFFGPIGCDEKAVGISQVNGGAEVAPGVRAIATSGHRPGHTSVLVASGGQQRFIQGDVTGIHQLVACSIGTLPRPRPPGAASSIAAPPKKGTIAGYHFGFSNVGTLAKDGNGCAFAPVKA